LGAEDEGFYGGGADFVDGCADGGVGKGGVEGALAGGVLAETVEGASVLVGYGKSGDDVVGQCYCCCGGTYFAERTLPKKTSSTSSDLMPALLTAAAKTC